MPNSGIGWFDWLKRWLGLGKHTVAQEEAPEANPNPTPADPPVEKLFTAGVAIDEFGESFIGVVEIASQGSRVTAGTYAKNVNHLTLSKQNMGPLQTGQRRFGFIRNRGGITIGPSSTGAIPTVDDIPAIRAALQNQGYLTPGGLYLIVAEDSNEELQVYDLLTAEAS